MTSCWIRPWRPPRPRWRKTWAGSWKARSTRLFCRRCGPAPAAASRWRSGWASARAPCATSWPACARRAYRFRARACNDSPWPANCIIIRNVNFTVTTASGAMHMDINASGLLTEMQSLQGEMRTSSPQVQAGGLHEDFSALLGKAINNVNGLQKSTDDLRTRFELGDEAVSLEQVMLAAQKSG